MTWTGKDAETLRQLWREGREPAEIARRLGGVTTDAVIGKARRMGLACREPAATARDGGARWARADSETLAAMWRAGRSGVEIAAALGRPAGAIYDRAERMGLPPRGGERGGAWREGRALVDRLRHLADRAPGRPLPPPLVDEPEPLAARLEALATHGCHWPIGDPAQAGFGWCGRLRARGGGPYCGHHHARAYQAGSAVRAEPPPSPASRELPRRGARAA